MKKIFALIIVLVFINYYNNLNAQNSGSIPYFITDKDSNFYISMNDNYGNKALQGFTGNVFIYLGLITNRSTSNTDWKYVKFQWGTTSGLAQTTNRTLINAANQTERRFEYKFANVANYNNGKNNFGNQSLRQFFNVTDTTEKILKLAILMYNSDQSKVLRNADGSDIFINVYQIQDFVMEINQPQRLLNAAHSFVTFPVYPTYTPYDPNSFQYRTYYPFNIGIGDTLTMAAQSNKNASFFMYYNDSLVNSNPDTNQLGIYYFKITKLGLNKILFKATANDGSNSIKTDSIEFFPNILNSTKQLPLPPNVEDGINFETGDTSVIFVQYAPYKNFMMVVGEFPNSNWQPNVQFLMNRTPDSNRFWIRITGLVPGQEYSYQFITDNGLKIADMWSHKILDPWNDPYIPTASYPNLKPYPTGLTTGIVSVLQTAPTPYNFNIKNFIPPAPQKLVIYELLIRDFLAASNYQTLIDTIKYLKNLGINAIELMPVSEFEGNISWGYNPNFHFALDKYYGTEFQFKRFVDSCHANGIAVLLDVVLNHVFGYSPIVQLYWDNVLNQPATNNPWLNPIPKHPFNVGYDFNHLAKPTQYYVSRFVKRWMNDFKIDGMRWDLSKGFTQIQSYFPTRNPSDDLSLWARYDTNRVQIWKRIYDTMIKQNPYSICILEHFANNDEEVALANYGMLLWGNANYAVNRATMGFSSGWDFTYGLSAQSRTGNNAKWSNLNLIGYAESHDEERLMYRNLNFGNETQDRSYSTKNLTTALQRMEAAASFYILLPGPKMIWQFGELGYDLSINYCTNGTVNNNCRLVEKPPKWNYLQDVNRKNLYNKFSKLIQLKLNPAYSSTFSQLSETNVKYNFTSAVKWMSLVGPNLQVVIVGNFDIVRQTASISFPLSGTWYNFMDNTTMNVSGGTLTLNLAPGEYYVLTNINLNNAQFYQISTAVNNLNYGTISAGDFVPSGANKTITISPAYKYKLDSLIINGRNQYNCATHGSVDYPATFNYTFQNIRGDSSIKAYFSLGYFFDTSKYKETNTSNESNEPYISIQPNPIHNLLNFHLSNIQSKVQISIISFMGETIFQESKLIEYNADISYDLTGKPAGYYLVTVSGTAINGKFFVKRMYFLKN